MPRSSRKKKSPRGIVAHFDRIGRHTSGWIVDQASGSAPRDFILQFDDLGATINASVLRPDVVRAGLAADPLVGFFVDLSGLMAHWQARKRKSSFPKSLSLIVDGAVAYQQDLPDPSEVSGTLESVTADGILGVVRGAPVQILDIDVAIYLDDILFAVVAADRLNAESDIPTKAFHLPISASVGINTTFQVSARIMISGKPLDGGPVALECGANDRLPVVVSSVLKGGANPHVSIVIPIYNAADELRACLDSVRRETTRYANLILIDDGSTDPEIDDILEAFESRSGVTIRRHSENLGYTASINEGIQIAGSDDVVLLNSDTVVPPRWLENLRFAAYSDHAIATVTPLSNNAGAFSAPEPDVDNPLPDGIPFPDIARCFRQESSVTLSEVTTASGFCMYIKRACLNEVGLFDEVEFPRGYGEENDFCMRALRAGWRHVIDDRTYVLHRRSASFGAQQRAALTETALSTLDARYPEYWILASEQSRSFGLLVARYHARRAIGRAATGEKIKPRLLTVISSESGGTPLANQDLASGLADKYDVYLLHSDRKSLTLSVFSQGQFQPVTRKPLATPIRLTKHFASAYDQLVAEWLVTYAIEFVHIRHIAWHSLGLTAVCKQLEIPVVFSFHDFYTVCPSVKLLDHAGRFCGGVCSDDEGHCSAELWDFPEIPDLKNNWVHVWRGQTHDMLENVDAFVTTSATTRDVLCENFPFLDTKPFSIVPHGRDFKTFSQSAVVPRAGTKLRLLAPGNISEAKGARVLARLKEIDEDDIFEIHVLGAMAESLKIPGAIYHGPYQREQFQDFANEIRPHFGLVLSIWPETHCHTLTELWAAGIPVIGFDIGAVGERIRASGGGVAVRDLNAEAVRTAITEIVGDRTSYHRLLAAVLHWQSNVAPHQTVKDMSAAYEDIYRAVMTNRSPFLVELGLRIESGA
ncbi:MAG: glycosyltransferase [Xanthobacteraceae bacterium]|nr:glycosyltransferase [Xanthobacteraceae bacterium]